MNNYTVTYYYGPFEGRAPAWTYGHDVIRVRARDEVGALVAAYNELCRRYPKVTFAGEIMNYSSERKDLIKKIILEYEENLMPNGAAIEAVALA